MAQHRDCVVLSLVGLLLLAVLCAVISGISLLFIGGTGRVRDMLLFGVIAFSLLGGFLTVSLLADWKT